MFEVPAQLCYRDCVYNDLFNRMSETPPRLSDRTGTPPRPSTTREKLGAALSAVTLLWINLYICRDLFTAPTARTNSMQGTWIGLARLASGGWLHATWWPYWDAGVPFEFTYAPLVPGLTAVVGALRGVSLFVGFHSVLALFYCLGPLTLFLMAWRLTRRVAASFAAALVYSLTSITQILVPDSDFGLARFWEPRRLFQVTNWDEAPHLAALALLPLVILFLARSIETRRKMYYAAAALAIAASVLASAFGAVAIVMTAGCLLIALGREHWARNTAIALLLGLWGWAIAAPFSSPTLMIAIRRASAASFEWERWSMGSYTALALALLGGTILWHFLRRWTADPVLRFFGLFAYLMSAIPIIYAVLHRHFLPQPSRYWMEMELGLSLALVFGVRGWFLKAPRAVRGAAWFLMLAVAGEQVVNFRLAEKNFALQRDLTAAIEYKAPVWVERNLPGVRVFLPGSVAQWANASTGVQQFAGGSYSMSINLVHRAAKEAVYWHDDPQVALTWLKAYGAGAVGISEPKSAEYWHPFVYGPRLQAMLGEPLWSEDGVAVYRVPVRETGLAHVVPETALVMAAPRGGGDVRSVKRYVAALDDASLPTTQFAWEGRNRIRIHATLANGQAVSVQVSYHPGWHATNGGRTLRVERDGLGMMWLRPGCSGPCEIQMDYDGGWELRICRWISWLALAAAAAAGIQSLVDAWRGAARARRRAV